MSYTKSDPSLAEVRRWRKEAQKEAPHLDSELAIEKVHRRAEEFMRTHGLSLKVEKHDPVKA